MPFINKIQSKRCGKKVMHIVSLEDKIWIIKNLMNRQNWRQSASIKSKSIKPILGTVTASTQVFLNNYGEIIVFHVLLSPSSSSSH